MAATQPVLGTVTMPKVTAYIEEPMYYGGHVITAVGSVRWQLVDANIRRRFTMEWTALTEAQVTTVETGWALVDNGTAAFTSPRNGSYTVDRDPDTPFLTWTWFTDGTGALRADGRMLLRET